MCVLVVGLFTLSRLNEATTVVPSEASKERSVPTSVQLPKPCALATATAGRFEGNDLGYYLVPVIGTWGVVEQQDVTVRVWAAQ